MCEIIHIFYFAFNICTLSYLYMLFIKVVIWYYVLFLSSHNVLITMYCNPLLYSTIVMQFVYSDRVLLYL